MKDTLRPVLEARGIEKVLGSGAGEVMALKGVNLELMPGELALLVGPSGSGKTTLLSILGCILSPTAGSLTIAGRSSAGLTPEGLANLRRAHVGFVFQAYNLVPTLTAAENVMLALDLRGVALAAAPALAARAGGRRPLASCQRASEQDERRRKAARRHRPGARRLAVGDLGR
jgi:putative ABC transport system ATP-binding protein